MYDWIEEARKKYEAAPVSPAVEPSDKTPFALCKGCKMKKDDLGFCMCTVLDALDTSKRYFL